MDDHSRYTWVFLLQSKQQVPSLIQYFLIHETPVKTDIQKVRTDNGLEFIQTPCATMFNTIGIIHQTSVPGTPQQNRRVERKHRHLLDTSRALKIQSNVPISFRGECLLTAAYLITKIPIAKLHWKTPHELLFGTVPDFYLLQVLC